MKVHRMAKGVILVGKAREIRAKLKEYGRTFQYVKDWVSKP
ncbi:Z-ring formation inhibitor MciZ [Bacillus inaquosorum]|nr:Z-ring formation inhibitor MciZ [Bacillus inaquosorum]MCY8725259.1 Z-ring formation inhibitor MciZ [Bacillus inaquosorum]MEC0639767.1 Z-ring formation inhibitor MciZ [Bacillus inaquosorum]